MRTHNFPQCCGARIITDFGYTNNFYSGDGPTQTIPEQEKERILTYLRNHVKSSYTGLTVIMLNSAQVKAGVEKLVLEVGWERCTDKAFYPGHGRYLTMYVYYHHPDKRSKNKDETLPTKTLIPVKKPSSSSTDGFISVEKARPGPLRKASLRLFSDASSSSSAPKKRLVRRRVTKSKKLS